MRQVKVRRESVRVEPRPVQEEAVQRLDGVWRQQDVRVEEDQVLALCRGRALVARVEHRLHLAGGEVPDREPGLGERGADLLHRLAARLRAGVVVGDDDLHAVALDERASRVHLERVEREPERVRFVAACDHDADPGHVHLS